MEKIRKVISCLRNYLWFENLMKNIKYYKVNFYTISIRFLLDNPHTRNQPKLMLWYLLPADIKMV